MEKALRKTETRLFGEGDPLRVRPTLKHGFLEGKDLGHFDLEGFQRTKVQI